MESKLLKAIELNISKLFGSDTNYFCNSYMEEYKCELGRIAEDVLGCIKSEFYNDSEVIIILKYQFLTCFHDCINYEWDIFENILKDYKISQNS